MENAKKLSESELENVSGGTPGHECLTDMFAPSEDIDVWECFKCHDVRERFTKDRTFWNTNNACECGGWYNLRMR